MPAASPFAPVQPGPHVLMLPKWYPGRHDPQLGDFIRKQAQAVALRTRVSVLYVGAWTAPGPVPAAEAAETGGLWELRCWFRANTHPVAAVRKAVNLVRYVRTARRGWRHVQRERGRPALLHVHILLRPALIAWAIGLRHGLPFVISEQSSEYLTGAYARKNALVKAAYHFFFRRAAAATAVSTHLADALVRHGLCTQCTVVPNTVPGTDLPLPPAGPAGAFLVVADLVPVKNVDGVLQAFARVHVAHDQARLTVIGDGPERARLERTANDLGLNGSVSFLGRMSQSEVLQHMGRAGAVIVNSRVETFSVVTGEALALGRPVIATRCGGPEGFLSETNGVLTPVGDATALTDAMRRMIVDNGRYSPQAIRETVSERFSKAAVAEGFLSVYQQVIDGPR